MTDFIPRFHSLFTYVISKLGSVSFVNMLFAKFYTMRF